jgi:ABC-type transport system substrate-binding protein
MKKVAAAVLAGALVLGACSSAAEQAEPEATPRTLVERESQTPAPAETAPPRTLPPTTAPPVMSDDEIFDALSSEILPGVPFADRQALAFEACELIDVYNGDFYTLVYDAAIIMTNDPSMPPGMAEDFGGMIGLAVPYACPEWQPALENYLNVVG